MSIPSSIALSRDSMNVLERIRRKDGVIEGCSSLLVGPLPSREEAWSAILTGRGTFFYLLHM